MNRVEHVLFGTGTVIEPRTTESGRAAYLVRFDGSGTDHLILTDSLKPSKSSAPDEPRKNARAKPTRARKTADEPISDKLLVPELDEASRGFAEDSEEIEPAEV